MSLAAYAAIELLDGRFSLAMLGGGPGAGGRAVGVAWVDGDSGRFSDGREFRLHGVDAPEGSPSRAQCTAERTLSSGSREAAFAMTNGKRVVVTRSFGFDTYARELVTLSVDGQDVAQQLVASGHVKRWNFELGHAKPDWCG